MNKRTLLSRFHADERGTATTEFVAMLPIFVIIYTGITDLYRVHKMHTGVQIAAQSKLWTEVFKVDSNAGPHMTVVSGGPTTVQSSSGERRALNANQVSTINHGIVGGAIALGGHMREGQATVGAFNILPSVRDKVLKTNINRDVLKDAKFPMSIMLDSPGDTIASLKGGGGSGYSAVVQKLAQVVTASGGTHAIVAGQRYGSVHAKATGSTTGFRVAGGGTMSFSTRYDAMVPPKALDTTDEWQSRVLPFIMGRFGAEGEKNYAVALRFGKAEWGGGSSSAANDFLNGLPDTKDDEINDKDEEGKEEGKNCSDYDYYNSHASECSGAGYSQPPPPPPPPNP